MARYTGPKNARKFEVIEKTKLKKKLPPGQHGMSKKR
jgi:hypothetical protein